MPDPLQLITAAVLTTHRTTLEALTMLAEGIEAIDDDLDPADLATTDADQAEV